MENVGVWIIGAKGSVASVVIAGVTGLAEGVIKPTGLVTELSEFEAIEFLPFERVIFGGNDVCDGSLRASFGAFAKEAHIDPQLVERLGTQLDTIDRDIKKGTAVGCGNGVAEFATNTIEKEIPRLTEIASKIEGDIAKFRKEHKLSRVIVVNLASTEPPVPTGAHTETLSGFETAIKNNKNDLLSASMIYAYAALRSGCPYINFTPSSGASSVALQQLAIEKGLPHTGRDGKTGETLIKSVLSAAFRYRALEVLSWQGYNILGNMDGRVLANDDSKESKIATKDSVLPSLLGYAPHTYVGIDYVPSLGDWKVAWDFIHFRGFFDTKMSMQFIWQGCDSILAAPLVLDLIRLTELAHRRGEAGALTHTALFFKQPLGCEVNDLHTQWQILKNYLKMVETERGIDDEDN